MRQTVIMLVLAGVLGLPAGEVQAYQDRDRISHSRSHQEVSFEVLRMLSTGMTKAEVLNRVGAPQHRFKNRGNQSWIYPAPDRWIVEVIFSGNNVINIRESRP